ncbi:MULTISPECIES: hypothetical protein [Bacillus]|uniref:DUF5673 domain-containing protein n=1 Tax=Bacillus infantis TaxID=324767 RepID=A0A5D4SKM5_9BACI|nr:MULTISPECIES: hypothetical protein [Bacillus]TYS62236.1 hypothetical protein FZD47_19395 [Bacillus infantis]
MKGRKTMWLDLFFIMMFLIGCYYLLQLRLRIKKAADLSGQALFPRTQEEYSGILLPGEWKEMQPITKNTKSYQYIKWGTVCAFFLMAGFLLLLLLTDWFDPAFLNAAYIFFAIASFIRQPQNLFIMKDGMILHGRFYSQTEIRSFETEKIVRWHPLYGLDSRADNGYQLKLKVKNRLFQPGLIAVPDKKHLTAIENLLGNIGIERTSSSEYESKKESSSGA